MCLYFLKIKCRLLYGYYMFQLIVFFKFYSGIVRYLYVFGCRFVVCSELKWIIWG